MFLSRLRFKRYLDSFPELVENNVGLRNLVKSSPLDENECPDELSVSLMSYKDFIDIFALNKKNKAWLDQWTVCQPKGYIYSTNDIFSLSNIFSNTIDIYLNQVLQDKGYFFKISLDGKLCGFICLNDVTRGALCSAKVGYWIAYEFAGRNIMPVALAMLTDFCFEYLLLHRVEVNICCDNLPSLRVVEKLGFNSEGKRSKYIFVNGKWADHYSYALTVEDVCCGGVLARYENSCSCF
ncbi:GNAT family N-acetyltransferase [Actinomyces sp. zg-332]|uniref:GNAT family N-acetyltransferase n=1 Tax=Actinomyces sp. zg-332 TaxID=2708340 RepID=UPI00142068F7|nr:GNAT family protein [Actinomyces sp. zg-332]QPK94356.1 GNAT family N-acetyltransferase [Actinomyces sp. zg-332]